jgi:hypothetical protein
VLIWDCSLRPCIIGAGKTVDISLGILSWGSWRTCVKL